MTSTVTTIEFKKLAIYYGWPSSVNASYSVVGAINVFKEYDLLVFGAGLEDPLHPDHTNTINIIAGLTNTKVFGYIDSTLPITAIQSNIDQWTVMGVAGIFLDKFGFDFGLTRVIQNTIVDYVHGKNMFVFVNAWNPDDAFAPSGDLVTHLGTDDWYLAESYQIVNDSYESVDEWKTRSEKIISYRNATDTKIAGITTTTSGVYDQNKFDYAYFSAMLYGFNAFGWGEQYFSASSAQLPFRPRKNFCGTKYVSNITEKNGKMFVFTNTGFEVNTVTRTVDYLI